MLRSLVVPALFSLLACAPTAAQTNPRLQDFGASFRMPLQVQILLRGEPLRKSISLTLRDVDDGRPVILHTDSRGSATVWQLDAKREYSLTVFGDGQFYATTRVQLTGDTEILRIHLIPINSPTGAPRASLAAPSKKAMKLHQQALKLLSENKPAESEEKLRAALKLDSGFTAPHLELAALLVRSHRVPEAEAILRKVVSAQPDNQLALVRLGILRHAAGDQVEAMRLLRQALEFEQHLVGAHLYLGACLLHQNQIEEAYQHLNHYLEAPDANRPLAHYYLGNVHMRRSEFEKAITSFEQFLAGRPASTNAEAVRRTIAQLKGRVQTAPWHCPLGKGR